MKRIGATLAIGFASAVIAACGGSQEPTPATPLAQPAPVEPPPAAEPAPVEEPVAEAPVEKPVEPIPAGFFTVTPNLTVKDVDKAVEYYTAAFGAEKGYGMPGPDGTTMHAEIKIGDSIIMIDKESNMGPMKSPETVGARTGGLMLYVEDVDAVTKQAVEAGGKQTMKPQDMFWGDRYAQVNDPFGHSWGIATHKEELTEEQMAARAKLAFAGKKVKDIGKGEPASSHIPEGYHTVTPVIHVAKPKEAIAFYVDALGAEERMVMTDAKGRVQHAEIKVGDSIVAIAPEVPKQGAKAPSSVKGATTIGLMIYTEDVDAAFAKATGAKAVAIMPPTDMFWGDRYGAVTGAGGHYWAVATHKEDLDAEEIQKRFAEQMKAMQGGAAPAEGDKGDAKKTE